MSAMACSAAWCRLMGASLAAAYPSVNLVGLYYPIGIAAIGVVVGLFGFRQTYLHRIWDEVGGEPAE